MAPCLLPKISEVEVTPSVASVESSEQFWRKLRQIWRICEPCFQFSLNVNKLTIPTKFASKEDKEDDLTLIIIRTTVQEVMLSKTNPPP